MSPYKLLLDDNVTQRWSQILFGKRKWKTGIVGRWAQLLAGVTNSTSAHPDSLRARTTHNLRTLGASLPNQMRIRPRPKLVYDGFSTGTRVQTSKSVKTRRWSLGNWSRGDNGRQAHTSERDRWHGIIWLSCRDGKHGVLSAPWNRIKGGSKEWIRRRRPGSTLNDEHK